MKVEIRRMAEADVSRVVAIENCWDYLSKWGEEGYLQVLGKPFLFCPLVAEVESAGRTSPGEEGALAGAAVLALMADHGELCNLMVPPRYLGKRVGRLLLAQCLEVARQRQLSRIFLEVRHSNQRAIRFYRRNGFRIVSGSKNYYRDPPEDAWVMEREAPKDPLPNGGSGVLKGDHCGESDLPARGHRAVTLALRRAAPALKNRGRSHHFRLVKGSSRLPI